MINTNEDYRILQKTREILQKSLQFEAVELVGNTLTSYLCGAITFAEAMQELAQLQPD